MTVSSKIAPPTPAIFTSDPLEQIFARDMFTNDNNHRGGLAYMMLNAAQSRRDSDQGTYMGALDRSNQTALMLSQLEEQFKHREAMAKLAAQLAPHGFLPSTMAGGRDLFPGGFDAADALAKLYQDEVRSKIAANYSKGSGSGDKVEYTGGVGEGGALVDQFKIKGGDLATVKAKADELKKQMQIQQLQGGPNRGLPGRVQGAAQDRYKNLGQ